jgi:hypothetical protein
MSLTRAQKEKLKKLVKKTTLSQAAEILKIDFNEAKNYLLDLWGKEKYQKRVKEKPEKTIQNKKILIFLAVLVFAVYVIALPNDFLSDDLPAIVQNPKINQPDYFLGPQFFPLHFNPRNFLLFLIHKIFGLNPVFFRLLNIFSHLGVVYLLYFLSGFFFSHPLPFVAASLYAVHPILVEGVTWISGGPYTNSAFFLLLAFAFWLLWIKNQKIWFYFLSLGGFFFALLFSERLIWFPVALLIYEILLGNPKKNFKFLIPYFLLVSWWTSYLLGLTGKRLTALETVYYQEPGLDNPFIKIPIAVTSYLELIFWPKNLTFYHSELIFTQTEYFLRLIGFLFFVGLIFYFLKKDRRLAFWLIFFLLTLSPTLTPLRIAWAVAERYAYLGTFGILAFDAFLIQKMGEKIRNEKISWIVFGVIILSLSIRTIIRNLDWRNQDTLWIATAKVSPSSHQNHNNLGDMYARHGNLEKAVEEFKKAIELKPNYADAYHNLANVYHQMGKDDLAKENYQKALEFNPSLWQSHQNLAALYFLEEKFDLAEQHLLKAVEINSTNPELYINLGILYQKMGKREKANEAIQKANQLSTPGR